MKKIIPALITVLLFTAAIVFGIYMQKVRPFPVPTDILQETLTEIDEPVIDDTIEGSVDEVNFDSSAPVTIPEELYEELDVSDLVVREDSIANQPDLWRAFLASRAPMSDLEFLFGCSEHLYTGAEIVFDLFIDENNQPWVAEATGTIFLGVGAVSADDFERIQRYFEEDQLIGCLQLSRRNYQPYYLDAGNLELLVWEDGNPLPENYEMVVLAGKVYVPLPEQAYARLNAYTGAGREPILIGQRYVLGYGEDGINVFDLQTWQSKNLLGLDYDGSRGISSLYKPNEQDPVVAFAYQTWENDLPIAVVFVYDFSEGVADYQQYVRYASLGWTIGSNEVFNLAESTDLEFIDNETIKVTEYPDFDTVISEGGDPYKSKTETIEWKFRS